MYYSLNNSLNNSFAMVNAQEQRTPRVDRFGNSHQPSIGFLLQSLAAQLNIGTLLKAFLLGRFLPQPQACKLEEGIFFCSEIVDGEMELNPAIANPFHRRTSECMCQVLVIS